MFKAITPIVLTCLLAAPVMAADGLPQLTKANAQQGLDSHEANQFMTILVAKLMNSIDLNKTTISFSASNIKIGTGQNGRSSVDSVKDLNAKANVIFTQNIVIGTEEILPSLPMQAQFKDLIPKISILLGGKTLMADVTSDGTESFKISAGFYDSRSTSELKAVSLPISLSNSVSPNLLDLKFTNLTIVLSAPSSEEKTTALQELNIEDKSDLKVTSKVIGNCSITDGTGSVSKRFDTCALGGYYFLNTKTNQSFPAIKFKISK